jgi:hypothetical protein
MLCIYVRHLRDAFQTQCMLKFMHSSCDTVVGSSFAPRSHSIRLLPSCILLSPPPKMPACRHGAAACASCAMPEQDMVEYVRQRIIDPAGKGYVVVPVNGGAPNYTYTIGLAAKLGHPELIILGMSDWQASGLLLSTVCEWLRQRDVPALVDGQVLQPTDVPGRQLDVPLLVRIVNTSFHEMYCRWGVDYVKRYPLDAVHTRAGQTLVQLVWSSDRTNHFPTDSTEAQPLLSRAALAAATTQSS